jgi:V/A-type H+-transporting ATPase subunit K
MMLIAVLMSLLVLGTIAWGLWLEYRPATVARHARGLRHGLLSQMALYVLATGAVLVLGVQDVLANPAAGGGEVSLGLGLAILGAGLPTAFATIGAGIAVGPVGSAALAVLAEKPEMLGRSLIYLGLAEGIAIYGLVISILLLDKIG